MNIIVFLFSIQVVGVLHLQGCAGDVLKVGWERPEIQYGRSKAQLGQLVHTQTQVTSGVTPEFPMEFKKRLLLDGNTSSERLAVRNNRIDPLNHFRKYKGGYDIENKHYWASTIFTGIYGYAIAAVWLLVGVTITLILCLCACCCHKKDYTVKEPFQPSHFSRYYCAAYVITIVLTGIVIANCGILLAANVRFHSRAKDVENTIIEAADNAAETIYNVTSTMASMEAELQAYDQNEANYLNSTIIELDSDAREITQKVHDNKGKINIALKVLYIAMAAIGSLNLAFVIAGTVCTILHTRQLFNVMIFLCWILIALDWLGFGIDFAIKNFVADTCVALREYNQNPENTTLSDILSCSNLESASGSVFTVRKELHDIINQVNTNISDLHQQGQKNGETALELIPYICNPFNGAPNYQYTGNCSSDSVSVSEFSQILGEFKCSGNATTECVNGTVYAAVVAYSTAAQDLINIIPELESLTNCSFVVDTFSIIVNQECSPLKSSISMLWISMLCTSTSMLFAIIFWLLIKFFQAKQKQFSRGTIMPQDVPYSAHSSNVSS